MWNVASHILLGLGFSLTYTLKWWCCRLWFVFAIFGLIIVEATQLEYAGFQLSQGYLIDTVIDLTSGVVGICLFWLIKRWI